MQKVAGRAPGLTLVSERPLACAAIPSAAYHVKPRITRISRRTSSRGTPLAQRPGSSSLTARTGALLAYDRPNSSRPTGFAWFCEPLVGNPQGFFVFGPCGDPNQGIARDGSIAPPCAPP